LSSSSNKKIRDRAPSEYFDEILTDQGGTAAATLAANLIDEQALDAIKRDDYDTFLNARSAALQKYALELSEW
jgi:hypothetical protein